MYLHLRIDNDEGKNLIEKLKNFCGDKLTIQGGEVLADVRVETTYESGLCAYFSEKHYGEKDYGIRIFRSENHEDDLFIPVELINTIFGL